MEQHAYTWHGGSRANEIRTDAGVFAVATGAAVIPSNIEKFSSVWDTGAMNTAIASTVVNKLGLQPVGFAQVGTGGGVVNAPVHLINIVLPNNVIIPNVRATELKALASCDVLIGMDIITQGDFALTHVGGATCFSFRMPSAKKIDFVPESNAHNMRLRSKVGTSKKQQKQKKRK